MSCAAAALAGAVSRTIGLVVIFGPLAVFFAAGAWMVWPRPVPEAVARRRYNRQNAAFKRLGIRYLIGPDWPESEDPDPTSPGQDR